jgi:hypothetical protein
MSDVRRDRWQRYLVLPPHSSKPTGYTRATTVAKTLDDGGGLIPWKAATTVVGAMRRPGLHAQWQELIARSPNPWYDTPQSKAECKRLVEECSTAGGSSDRAEVGTALHAMIAGGVDADGLTLLQPSTRADIDAYRSTLAAAGVIIDTTMLERMVVLDMLGIAGTADNLRVTLPGYGDVVADLKTGTDLTYSWQSIAVQLAIYAHGDNTYEQGEAADGSQDVRGVMPNVSKQHALVIHLPAGEARCVLYVVDIEAGWEAVEHSMWTRDWRKRRALASALKIESAPDTQTLAATAGEVPAAPPTPTTAPVAAPAAPPPFDSTDALLPTASVESSSNVPAAVSNQAAVSAGAFIHLPIDEGDAATDLALDALKIAYDKLVGASRSWVTKLGKQATDAGVSFNLRGDHGKQTVRRFELIRALVAYARANESGFDVDSADEIARAIAFSVVADSRIETAWTVGSSIGHLDATRAALFAQRVHEFITTPIAGVMSDNGHLRLRFAA